MENPISQRIKEVRKDKNLTQKDFAIGLKINQSSISTMENGGNPDILTVLNLIVYYNVNLNWLFTGKGNMYIDNKIIDNKNNPEYWKAVGKIEVLEEHLIESKTNESRLKTKINELLDENNRLFNEIERLQKLLQEDKSNTA